MSARQRMNRPHRPAVLVATGLLLGGLVMLPACRRSGERPGGLDGAAGQERPAAGGASGESGWGAAGKPAGADAQGPGAAVRQADPGAVATIGGSPVPYRAFERYLNDNAVEAGEEGDQADVIKSRLLDQFIEEQLLLREADRLKIAVSDAEVDAYMKELGLTEGDLDVGAPDGRQAFRDKIKTGLIVQKVKEAAVLKTIHVTPGEIDDELRKRPDLARGESRFVLRQILLEDRGTAEDVRRQLAADPGRFEEVARQKSGAPDHGAPRAFAEEDLPGDLRAAVAALQPGEVSPVLDYAGAYLVIQLVRREEARPADTAEVRKRVESELFRQKADQVMEGYLADLKEKTEIHVNRAILPFQYTGEIRN
jgi:parvulin-like peptidyl-prolyl isomerase